MLSWHVSACAEFLPVIYLVASEFVGSSNFCPVVPLASCCLCTMEEALRAVWSSVTVERVELFFIAVYQKIERWYSSLKIDDGIGSSLILGLTLGIGIVTFLVFFPGDPTEDYNVTSEEEALRAMKKKLYKKEGDGGKEGGSSASVKDRDKSHAANTLGGKKAKGALKEGASSATSQSDEKDDGSGDVVDQVEMIDPEILKKLEAYEKLKQAREAEVDAEAEMFLEEFRKKGMSEETLRKMCPENISLEELKEQGKTPWIVTIMNWFIPLALVGAIIYTLQKDFDIHILDVMAHFFPREAAVFSSISNGLQGKGSDSNPSRAY
jgi:hypothetical protein